MPAPSITIPVNVSATAFGEALHLTFELDVSADGEVIVRVFSRVTDSHHRRVLAEFDAYEWARLRKAMSEIDELLAAIQERGATFKIG
jgi:hypothetical protein